MKTGGSNISLGQICPPNFRLVSRGNPYFARPFMSCPFPQTLQVSVWGRAGRRKAQSITVCRIFWLETWEVGNMKRE